MAIATKINLKKHSPFMRALLLTAFVMVVAAPTHALGFAQGYFTDDSGLQPGMAVQLSDSDPAESDLVKVERASIEEPEKVIGLASQSEDSFVVVANAGQQIFVQANGEASALVSDMNGEVQEGDQLTLSPLRGVLMKANPTNKGIRFGTALESFPETYETYPIDGGDSGLNETKVASVRVNLDGKFASTLTTGEDLSPLAQLGRSISGKDIGEIRVLIALVIFLIVLIAEGTIIYGAVSSAITAMGRNPLAGKSIKQELIRILFIALLVLLVGLSATYAILKV